MGLELRCLCLLAAFAFQSCSVNEGLNILLTGNYISNTYFVSSRCYLVIGPHFGFTVLIDSFTDIECSPIMVTHPLFFLIWNVPLSWILILYSFTDMEYSSIMGTRPLFFY